MPLTEPFTLVLSGGGLKGLAHIGVFQALEEAGLTPNLVVGCSMGSLIAAAWAGGMSVAEMRRIALGVRRRDVFQVAHADMAFRRMQAPAIYRREPLERLIATLVGDLTFENLVHPLVINTVEINSGMQVIWGRPGLRDVRVGDCVFASCALPGMLPPQEIRGAFYVDGALVENLPVRIAALEGNSPVIALDVGSSTVLRAEVEKSGFAATYLRGLEIVMDRMMETDLRQWEGPPLLLVHPRVEHVGMFSFNHSRELIEEGYRATRAALAATEGFPERGPGIYPRRTVQVRVDRERCIGCGNCVMHAPAVFRLDAGGRAETIDPIQEWSPIDGGYVRNCPTYAISARLADAPPPR